MLLRVTTLLAIAVIAAILWIDSAPARAASRVSASPKITVGVVKAEPRPMAQNLTLASELVPFQQIDVYAKESGYVKQLDVDYGSHVKAGQVLATLEIPELQMQVQQDQAAIRAAADEAKHADNRIEKVEDERNVLHLQYERLNHVAESKPGMVAQQEVDDAQGKDLAAAAQVEASKETLAVAQNQLAAAQAKRTRDQVMFDYSKITAPFSGVITKRYANLGTLVQAGTNSSTQALPIVQLSEDDLFRLVIPVPEAYVHDIRLGDPVKVFIPSLNQTFPGKIARFSVDVNEDTRTMHTEVDVPNPNRTLMPGLYAEATLSLAGSQDALAAPIQAIHRNGDQTSVFVVSPSGMLQICPVTLGIQTANSAEIDSGLQAGELVVVSDTSELQAGEKVVPKITRVLKYDGPANNNGDS